MARQRGFTLIELLVTVAVMVIMATVAVPGFQNLVQTNREAVDYNDVLSGLLYARSEAVKRRESISATVTFDADDGWKVQVTRDNDGTPQLLRQLDSRDGSIFVTPNTVIFNALGRREACDTDAGACLITVADTDIIVEPSGSIERGTE